MPQRRRQRLARPRHVEHHRPHQRHEAVRIAEHRQGLPPHERRASVGGRQVDLVEQRLRPRRVAPEQARLGPSHRDRGRLVVGRPLEPQLRARPVALRKVQIGQLDERVAPRLAPRLGHRQGPHERLAHLGRPGARRAPRPTQPHPDLRSRRRALRELLERHRQLRLEPARLARVGQQREAQGRSGRARQHPVRRRPRPQRVPCGERVLSVAQIVVRAGEDDLDLADPAPDDVAQAHGAGRVAERKGAHDVRTSSDGLRAPSEAYRARSFAERGSSCGPCGHSGGLREGSESVRGGACLVRGRSFAVRAGSEAVRASSNGFRAPSDLVRTCDVEVQVIDIHADPAIAGTDRPRTRVPGHGGSQGTLRSAIACLRKKTSNCAPRPPTGRLRDERALSSRKPNRSTGGPFR